MPLLARSRELRIGRNASQTEYVALPILSVLIGSLVPIIPVVATAPILPPFGLLAFLAWRLLRREIWSAWMALPLGLFDDMLSGQPFGSAILLWTACLIIMDMLDRRMVWRDFRQDWSIAGVMIAGVLAIQCAVASPPGVHTLVLIVPQVLLSILCFPLLMRAIAMLDRVRNRR